MNDAIQEMLFGTPGTETISDDVANCQLRLCTLNVAGPSPNRAAALADWLIASRANALVLTEVRPGDGGRRLLATLRSTGYHITTPLQWQNAPNFCALATKGFAVTACDTASLEGRLAAADLSSDAGTIQLVGIYGPTNGMTDESSRRRARFQDDCLRWLGGNARARRVIAGDLNVVEPGHQPPLPDFRPHDYAFYKGILATGLHDAYRRHQPQGIDHSWSSPRHGAQRLDHVFVAPTTGKLISCTYDHATRTGGLSDHSTLLAAIDIADDEVTAYDPT